MTKPLNAFLYVCDSCANKYDNVLKYRADISDMPKDTWNIICQDCGNHHYQNIFWRNRKAK